MIHLLLFPYNLGSKYANYQQKNLILNELWNVSNFGSYIYKSAQRLRHTTYRFQHFMSMTIIDKLRATAIM